PLPKLSHPLQHGRAKIGNLAQINNHLLGGRRIDLLLHFDQLGGNIRLGKRGVSEERRDDQHVSLLLGTDKFRLAHGDFSAAAEHRLIIVTSFPVSLNVTSSMKVRISSSPRPFTFS